MLHLSHRRSMRQASLLIAFMSIGLLAAWLQPGWSGFGKIEGYVPIHTVLEIMSVVVAVLVFASGWNAFSRSLPRSAVILAASFLGVAILDFSHALSYSGMPDYVTPSSPQKAINFWLVARLLAALALLSVVALPSKVIKSESARYGWLLGVLAVVAIAHLVFFFRPHWVPATFDPATGLTAFKVGVEFFIMALLVLTAGLLWRSMAQPQSFNATALFAAACILALSEAFFTLYVRVNDFYNLMGHLYKVVAYAFLYRAVFVQVIEEPYRELEEMRDRLHATLDAVPDVMIEMDLEGRYHSVHSSRPESLLRPTHQLLGKTVHEVLPQAQAEAVIGALNDALVKGNSIGVQLELQLADSRRWFELSVARKGQPVGSQTRFIMISRDITERKQVEAALLQQEAAQQASKAKSEFLSRVSHELRTPLNAVIGFSQLLMHGSTASGMSATQKLHAEYILQAGQHLLEMINDILDLTRIDSGEAELLCEPVGVSELFAEVLPMVSQQARAMNVQIEAEAVLQGRWRVLGDKRRIKQVLLNILSNAIKYNRSGGKVTINCIESNAHAGMLEVLIVDTGRGLTSTQIQGLFEPFNRLGADQQGIEGTGLGLVITRRLVEAMNGEIRFDSTPHVGTIVTLTFPMDRSVIAAQAPSDGRTSGVPAEQASTGHQHVARVLCVEDNPLNIALLQAIFDLRPGLNLQLAESGQQALDLLRVGLPDLILIDMNLPDMHGSEVLKQIRQLPQGADLLCIAMSADVFGDPLGAARDLGFADFWHKPLNINEVLRQLDALVGGLDNRQARLWETLAPPRSPSVASA